MARSAHREAAGYFEQALSALAHLPQEQAAREQAVDLWLALRNAFGPLGDLGRVLAYLREAETLALALDDPRRLGQVSLFLTNYFSIMAAHDQAITAGQRALALATASEEGVLQALANFFLGFAYWLQGNYQRAIDCLRQTIASLDGVRPHERFGLPHPPPCSAAPRSPRAMPSWAASLKESPLVKKGAGSPRRTIAPGAIYWPRGETPWR